MTRPYVTVTADNKLHALLRHLEEVLPGFSALPGVTGITLNGGLSRGYADHLSEIDLTFYLDCETSRKWKEKKAPIPSGIVKFDSVLYDIKIINYDEEHVRSYGESELWDLSYAQILYDPHEKIRDLFLKKLRSEPDISIAAEYLWEAYWYFKLTGDIWIHREDPLQGHFVLNESVKALVKALFAVNKERIPHDKWLIHMSYTLDWTPENWKEKLTESMSMKDSSMDGLRSRQQVIENLWREMDSYLINTCYPTYNISSTQISFYSLLKLLVQKRSMSILEWSEIADLSELNTDPFHKIIEISEDMITLNLESFLSLSREDIYSWHFEVVESVIRDLDLI